MVELIGMMHGLCYVCGKPTTITCKLCGKPVCSEHSIDGMCINCARGRGFGEKKG